MAGIKLAIFDFDGTIMDTRKTIVAAKQETMKQLGLPVLDESICAATIGLPLREEFKKFYPEMGEEMLERCVLKYKELFRVMKEEVPPVLFPHVMEALDMLKSRDITCTIATSRGRGGLTDFLNRFKLTPYFNYYLAAEDTSLQKPNAEPVIKTMNDLSFALEDTIVIGDMPVDIFMGRNAGVKTCGVTYGNSDRESLSEAGADYIIDDMSELVEIIK